MDQQLKERLVGAVVLMTAAVLVIPLILSGPREGRAPVPGAEPAPASPQRTRAGGFSSRVVPLDAPATVPAPAPAPAPAAPQPPPREPERPAPAAPAAPVADAAVSAPPVPATGATAAGAKRPAMPSGWVVQLGSFSNARNAHALRDRLTGSGYTAFAQSAGRGSDAVTRVFVGPEPDRERAVRRLERLARETGLKGIVVRYPDE